MTTVNKAGLNELASKLNVPPLWVDKLIQFESGWNPLARNPKSGARGLIQFMNSTAKGMGFKNADDLVKKYPDTSAQMLGPVYTYLKTYAPFPTEQSFHMAVFLPIMRKKDRDTIIPSPYAAPNWPITTPGEYMDVVNGKITMKQLMLRHPKGSSLLVMLTLLGTALYFIIKKKGGL